MQTDIEMVAAVDAAFDALFGDDTDEIMASFARMGVGHEVVEARHVELSDCDNGGLDSWGDL